MSERTEILRQLIEHTFILNKCAKLVLRLGSQESSKTSLFPEYVFESRKLIMEMVEANMFKDHPSPKSIKELFKDIESLESNDTLKNLGDFLDPSHIE
jgi:hypothetical protein